MYYTNRDKELLNRIYGYIQYGTTSKTFMIIGIIGIVICGIATIFNLLSFIATVGCMTICTIITFISLYFSYKSDNCIKDLDVDIELLDEYIYALQHNYETHINLCDIIKDNDDV